MKVFHRVGFITVLSFDSALWPCRVLVLTVKHFCGPQLVLTT